MYLEELFDDRESGDLERQPSRRQIAGAVFMHGALEDSPECFVALRDDAVVGALGFVLKENHVGGTMLGTRQSTKGAAFALLFALAREAYHRDLPVLAIYVGPDAKSFHVRIGRRLDEKHKASSEWFVDDCRYIVDGTAGRV